MSVFRKSLSATMGRVLAAGCQFLTVVLVAAFLGPRAQGNYAFLILIPLIASSVFDAGLSHANMYLIGKGRFSSPTISMAAFLWSVLWGAMVLGIWLLWQQVGTPLISLRFLYPFRGSLWLIDASIAAVGLTLFFNILVHTYLGRDRIDLFNGFLVGRAAAALVCVVVASGLLGMGLGGVFVAWMLSLLASVLLLFFREVVSLRPRELELRRYYREALGYGLKLHFGSLFILLMYRLDHLFVMTFRGSADLGRYHLATLVAESLLFITGPMYMLTIPRTARGGASLANRETPRSFRVVFWVFVLGALPLYGLFRLLLGWLAWRGYAAGGAAEAFALLLPGVIFLGGDQILSGDLAGRGKQIWNTVVASGMLIMNVGLDLWWIPRYGIQGAAAASSVAYIVGCLITMGIFLHLARVSWRDLWVIRREDIHAIRAYLKVPERR